MTATTTITSPIVLRLVDPAARLTLTPIGTKPDGYLEQLCADNPDLRIEREADGKITIMAPVTPNSGANEAEFIADLKLYARKNGGKAFSSNAGFTLPDTSVRAADASYISEERLAGFNREDFDHFTKIVPDFVVEVISPSDTIASSKRKMSDVWIANGVALAWLVDVPNEKLWVYRQNGSVDLIEGFDRTIGGEGVLPGFEFDLRNLIG